MEQYLETYGVVGSFDTNCMMRGEDTALFLEGDEVPELSFAEIGSGTSQLFDHTHTHTHTHTQTNTHTHVCTHTQGDTYQHSTSL